MMTFLQLSLLEVRRQAFKKNWAMVQKHCASWFLFAADFPYEESSLVGLRISGVVRSLILDELEFHNLWEFQKIFQ
jgi:hypothetical protein